MTSLPKARLSTLIGALAGAAGRGDAARALARQLAADDLLLLVRDDDTGALLPALGFPTTLRWGDDGLRFLDRVLVDGDATALVPWLQGGATRTVRGVRADDGSVVVLVEPTRVDDPALDEVVVLVPVLAVALAAERAAAYAAAQNEHTGRIAARMHDLARRLEVANRTAQSEIQERRRVEGELARAAAVLERNAEDLKRSNGELQRFAGVASHDLQEPLRTISSFLDLLKRRYQDQLDDKARGYIDHAVDGAHRLADLVKSLLTYAQVGSEQRPFVTVDLDAVLADVAASLAQRIADTGATVTFADLPPVQGDPILLAQLFQNLVSNAIKFRRPDVAPVVVVSAAVRDGMIQVAVNDNGIGIPRQHLASIFEVFRRLHDRKTYEGSGIGLATCRFIAERHGGTIVVDSEEGVGSTFTVRLAPAEH